MQKIAEIKILEGPKNTIEKSVNELLAQKPNWTVLNVASAISSTTTKDGKTKTTTHLTVTCGLLHV